MTTQLVLLTPVLLVMILAVVQMALWWHAAHLADAAAGRGATVAARFDATAADGTAAVRSFLAAAGVDPAAPPQVGRSATTAQATVTVGVARLLPGFPSSVRRTSVTPVERFVPEAER